MSTFLGQLNDKGGAATPHDASRRGRRVPDAQEPAAPLHTPKDQERAAGSGDRRSSCAA